MAAGRFLTRKPHGSPACPRTHRGEDRLVCQEAKKQIFPRRPSSPHPQHDRGPIWGPFSGFESREPRQGGGKGRQDPG